MVELDRFRLEEGLPVVELLQLAGLAASNGEARRLIRGGGARLNDEAVVAETLTITPSELRDGCLKLSAGRKRHVIVRAV